MEGGLVTWGANGEKSGGSVCYVDCLLCCSRQICRRHLWWRLEQAAGSNTRGLESCDSPPFSGSSSQRRTMLRHSLSRAGSVWRAVAVVMSCTMVVRNSFLFSALVRTFRKVRRRDRNMAHTKVPNRGSNGSALCQHSPNYRQ